MLHGYRNFCYDDCFNTDFHLKPSAQTDVLWIGLNDQRNQMLFEWSDRSHVTFTQWQTGEPSHATNHQEDCVLIRGKVRSNEQEAHTMLLMNVMIRAVLWPMQDGKWADHMCEKTYGYICKKKASTRPSEGAQEEANPGCKLVSDDSSVK